MKAFQTAMLASAALAMTSGQAMAQAKPCVTGPEVEAIMLVLLPDALKSVGETCAAALPTTALLRRPTAPMFARYQAEVAGNAAAAQTAFVKIAGEEAAPFLQGEGGLAMMSAFITPMIAKGVKPRDCGAINRMVELLEPLPPRNLAAIFATVLQLAERDKAAKGQKGDIPVCPLPEAP